MISGGDGIQIGLDSQGSGPLLVFTHGWVNDQIGRASCRERV